MKCKYHNTKKAQWHCQQCDTPFCMDCCDIEANMIAPRCLLCRSHLNTYGISDVVEPFWNKIGSFNKYPLHANAISFLKIFAVIALVASLITYFVPFTLIKILVKLAVLSTMVGYAFKALTKTASGKLEPPTYDESVIANSDNMLAGSIWIFIGLVLFGFALNQMIGGYSLLIYMATILFCLPAITIILAMDKHVTHALNPMIIGRTIFGIGAPYLLLAGFSLVIYFSLNQANAFVDFWLPEIVASSLIYLFTAFFSIILFHMYGYAAYQYHAELGYGIDVETLVNNTNVQEKSELRELAHADVYIQEGRYEDAEAVLYKIAQIPNYTVQALDKLIRLNIARQNPVGVIKAAKEYFSNPKLNLIAQQAFQTYLAICKFEPRFKPMNANARAVLIGQIRGKAQLNHFERLSQDLKEKLAEDDALPKALLATAKYHIEILNDDPTGAILLKSLLTEFPSGEHRLETEQLLKVIQSMAG